MTETNPPTDPVSDAATPDPQPEAERPAASEAPDQRDRLRGLLSQKRGEREQVGKHREQEQRRQR